MPPTPWARSARLGPCGAFSSASVNKRPSTPVVCAAKASVPAKGPSPAEIKSKAAHTNSGMDRRALSSTRMSLLTSSGRDACDISTHPAGRLASSAKPAAINAAKSVPKADMASVSTVAPATFRKNLGFRSGGKNSARNRPMLRAASKEKNCAHCKSKVRKLATTNAKRQSPTHQTLRRASKKGGGNWAVSV